VLDFIEIIRRLQAAGVAVHGLLVGDYPAARQAGFREECRRRIAAAGLEHRITVTGHRDDLREILSIADAVVSLSRHPEAFGRTVNEALSLGRPVAGYAHGGVGEQLAELFPAGRVRVGDIAAMTALLRDWYPSPPAPGPVRVATLESMQADTLALYESLAGTLDARGQ
jgi:glycosyltransferase involved in cell wall biosynthesis